MAVGWREGKREGEREKEGGGGGEKEVKVDQKALDGERGGEEEGGRRDRR